MIAVERQHVIFKDSFEDEWDVQFPAGYFGSAFT